MNSNFTYVSWFGRRTIVEKEVVAAPAFGHKETTGARNIRRGLSSDWGTERVSEMVANGYSCREELGTGSAGSHTKSKYPYISIHQLGVGCLQHIYGRNKEVKPYQVIK